MADFLREVSHLDSRQCNIKTGLVNQPCFLIETLTIKLNIIFYQ